MRTKTTKWFSNNYMKMNSDKCHLILSSDDENKKIELNEQVTNNTQVPKLFGVHIEHKLKFDTHIKTLSKKVGKKLHALARVIKYMSANQAQLLMRTFIMSQFSCCLLIWMYRSRKINNQINKLHARALRLFITIKALLFGNFSKEISQSLFMKEIFKYY